MLYTLYTWLCTGSVHRVSAGLRFPVAASHQQSFVVVGSHGRSKKDSERGGKEGLVRMSTSRDLQQAGCSHSIHTPPRDSERGGEEGSLRMSTSGDLQQAGCSHSIHTPPQLSPDEMKEIRRLAVIRCIEEHLVRFNRCMRSGEPMTHAIPRRGWENTFYSDRVERKPQDELSVDELRLTHRACGARFTIITRLFRSIYILLTERETMTTCQLYCHDRAKFLGAMKPSRFDHAFGIEDVCCLLDVSPWDLGIMPMSKGLVVGPLRFLTANDEDVDCMKKGGALIPRDVEGIKSIVSTAQVIIVIEKDAAFQKCIKEGILDKPWVIVTGKGVPDVVSCRFVNILWTTLQIPVYAMVDADPYGIETMCTYRFGSCELSHLADTLATPAIEWLGIYPTEIIPYIPLTPLDTFKLRSLMARQYVQAMPKLKAEIQFMLDEDKKPEITGIIGSINVFISKKLSDANFI